MEFIDSSFFPPYILFPTCLLFMLRGLSQREISRSAWSVLPAGDESGGMNCSGRKLLWETDTGVIHLCSFISVLWGFVFLVF